MILQALTAYYEQLLQKGAISAPGWDHAFNVSFYLVIDDSGRLLRAEDKRAPVQKGKKQVLAPIQLSVPAHVEHSSNIAPSFLCNNASYLLGADEKGKPERAVHCFEACAALHHKLLDGVASPAAAAILAFFDTWQPSEAKTHPALADNWKDITGNANLLFLYEAADGTRTLATEDPAIRAAWRAHYNSADPDAPIVPCLVTGKSAPLARTHPTINGGTNAKLVSFNEDAFCSYGYDQGENAHVSKYAAFAYAAALNALRADRNHCRIIGDTTVVCWAENASPAAASLGMFALFGAPEETGIQEGDLTRALELLAAGEPCDWLDETLNDAQHFYILGYSFNKSRIYVRFFMRDTLGVFAKRLHQHAKDLEIVRPTYDKRETLSIWALAQETVKRTERTKDADQRDPTSKKKSAQKKNERKERTPSPIPQLPGDLLWSILTDRPYPTTLLNGVALRIQAERKVTPNRAAILKAYYLRNPSPLSAHKEVLTVELNENSNYLPYVLGRLFFVLEALQNESHEAADRKTAAPEAPQQDARKTDNRKINSTIRERYFNSACGTPAMVFPTLINLAQKHLNKLPRGQEVYYQQQLSDLLGRIHETFPLRLSLPDQGAFQLGYYHQMQTYYTKKSEEE